MEKTKITPLFVIAAVLTLASTSLATDRLVPSQYSTIQAAIDAADPNDTVIVANGTYTGTGNRDIDFLGKPITIRSENGPEYCIIDVNGSAVDPHRGFIFQSYELLNSVLDGFTITNGYLSDTYGGAAILCDGIGLIIKNCFIVDNVLEGGGGGSGCAFYSSQSGGGIFLRGGYFKIINCVFSNNSATYGGAIGAAFSLDIKIVNCTFYNNSSIGDITLVGKKHLSANNVFYNDDPCHVEVITWYASAHEACSQGNSYASYCLLQNGTDIYGTGNIFADPCFADPCNGDFHLLADSACIDSGTNDPCGGLPPEDLDGVPRPLDGNEDANAIADMGAYEYNNQIPGIAVSTIDFSFSAYQDGPNPANQILTIITNSDGTTLNWQITESCSWLTVTPETGSSTGEPNDVTLSVDITGLDWGDYNCVLTISDPCAFNSPKTVPVALTVTGSIIGLSSSQFNFSALQDGSNPQDQILTVHNAGGGTLNWGITEDSDWLSVIPDSGSSTGEPNEVTLSVDITGMDWGIYDCNLTISDPCAQNNPQIVPVTLTITGPIIELSSSQFQFAAEPGGPNPNDQILTVSNSGGGTLNWQIDETCSWLTVSPDTGSSTGEPDDVTLSVDITGLSWGQYNCNLTISDPCAQNNPQTVPVTLTISGPIIELSGSQFQFTADPCGPNPENQILAISNSGGGTLNWQIDETCPWLDVVPATGSSTGEPNEVVLSVDITGMEWGTYNCNLTISDPCAENNPQNISVQLSIYSGCFDTLHPDHDEWLAAGSPLCWCNAYHCYGDADGAEEGSARGGYYWVSYTDLTLLAANWQSAGDTSAAGDYPTGDGICADFGRNEEGCARCSYYRVSFTDLTILATNWQDTTTDTSASGDDPYPHNCGGTFFGITMP